MPHIVATATAVPSFSFDAEDALRYLKRLGLTDSATEPAIRRVFRNAGVERRYAAIPLDELFLLHSLTETSALYREHAVRLGRTVAAQCLANGKVAAQDVDLLLTVSCTGIMLPSLDAYLINELGFRPNVKRLPITELGCAAGAAALARARDFLLAFPAATVLIVSVELPVLTFQHQDGSMANLISAAIFGDGAAAVLVSNHGSAGPELVDSETHLFPDSYDELGFDLKDGGLHIVLSQEIATRLRREMSGLVAGFLARHCLTTGDLTAYLLHPGGKKLLLAMEEALQLERAQTQPSWDVLQHYGNQSSAAVLFVLHEWLTTRPTDGPQRGLLAAFGPGFSAELLLLRWQ